MKFTKDNRPGAFNLTGHYVSGRWTIVNTAPRYWELRLDDCKVMGYTSLAAAKAGAEEYAAA
jgi:predicted methyltransferase